MRRSLHALLAIVFLVLLLVVVYALTGLSGPQTALQEAEDHYRAGRFNAAIRVLDLASRSSSLQGDPDLRRRLLDLRYRAHRDQRNFKLALADLDTLLDASRGEQPDLELDRIWLLILNDRTEEGLGEAQRFLERHPDSGRALELAGEACQKLYLQDTTFMYRSLNRNLTPEVRNRAWRAMQDYLYRPTGDPEVMAGLDRFHDIMDARLLGRDREDTSDRELGRVRQRIQQALAYYRQSLELEGEPVGAFNGFAFALDRAGRHDDLLAQSEIYLRRFDHFNVVEAANHAAKTHLDAGRMASVVDVANRFLPPGSWRERMERGQLLGGERHLLLHKARALRALGDTLELQRTAAEAGQMADAGVPMRPELYMILALHYESIEEWELAARHLENLCGTLVLRGLPPEGPDPLLEAMRLRIAVADRRGAPPGEVEAIFAQWLRARPDAPEPYLDYARFAMEIAKMETAYLHAARAFELAGQDEEALEVWARAADGYFGRSSQGSVDLLNQCLRLQAATPPDLRDPVLLLPLAELALERGHPGVAMACAELGSQRFIWSRWPRMLQARAARLGGRPDLAVVQLESLLEYHPGDAAALNELRSARIASGRSADDLLADLVRCCEPQVETFTALMALALGRGDARTAARIAERAEAVHGTHPDLLELMVETWALRGDEERMEDALGRLLAVTSVRNLQGAKAVARDFLLRAGRAAPEEIQEEVEALAKTLSGHGELLLDMTRELVELGRKRAAYLLVSVLVEQEHHQAARGGPLFGLAGRLALDLGLEARAVDHLAAAASFDDGADAILPLALTLLKLDREAEALPWIAELEVVDSVTATLAVRGGRSVLAIPWMSATLGERPLHPEANTLLALATPEPSPWPGLRDLVNVAREPLLELLTFLGAQGFSEHAVSLARSLRDAYPDSFPAELLHLRALGQAGRLAEAMEALERLRDTHGDRMELLDAAARLALDNAALSTPMGDALIQAVTSSLPNASPAMVVAAIRGMAGAAAATGGVESALDMLGRLWRDYPEASGAGLGQASVLLQYRRPLAALELLTVLEPTTAAGDRRLFWESWFIAAGYLAWEEGNDRIGAVARDQAERVLREEEAYGSAVHFLLEDDLRRAASGEDLGTREEQRTRALDRINRHLRLYVGGGDPNPSLVFRSLQWLELLDGTESALSKTDELLRKDASVLAVWNLRAQLLERAGRPQQAVAELRSLLAHVLDRDLVWTLARIAGEAGIHDPAHEQLLLEAYDGKIEDPDAHLVQGLLALRAGRYDEAESQLGAAAPRPDGAALYYRALANLSIPGDAAARRARSLFRQLLADYPDSPLTLYVGSFVLQLGL